MHLLTQFRALHASSVDFPQHVSKKTLSRLYLTLPILLIGWSCPATANNATDEETAKESAIVTQETSADVLKTTLGSVHGVHEQGVAHFRGIPYAQPPIGELRFRPPEKFGGWDEPRDATEFPNRCIQQPDSGIFGQQPAGKLDEDCLYLNVVTPNVEGSHRPVLFWIHGGGFTQGSANGYDGSILAREGDVVVVTINYRLGALGFLNIDELGPEYEGSANNGIRDQVLALNWVRDNIADYGGNPDNVTIFGESAGGASILTLLATPSADGLYHKAIAHSPGTTETPPDDHLTVLEEHFNAEGETLLTKLKSMPASELLAMQGELPSIGSAIDGVVVTRSPDEAIVDRGSNGVPLIAGTNRDEGTLFSAIFKLFAPTEELPIEGMARAVTAGADPQPFLAALRTEYPQADEMTILERVFDAMFLKAAQGSAQHASETGVGGWLYRFDYATTKPVLGQDVGATHAAEIPFTFNRFDSTSISPIFGYDRNDQTAKELARQWSETIIAFAKTGDPNGAGLPEWPQYDANTRATLVLDANPRIEHDLNRNLRELWEGKATP